MTETITSSNLYLSEFSKNIIDSTDKVNHQFSNLSERQSGKMVLPHLATN
jgi:hypothetical protein